MAVDFDNGPFEASRISTTLWRKIGGTLEELWRNFGGTLEELKLPPILQIPLHTDSDVELVVMNSATRRVGSIRDLSQAIRHRLEESSAAISPLHMQLYAAFPAGM